MGEPPPGQNPPKRINIINISPVLATFSKNVLKTGEMLIMLIMLIPLFQKVAKTGEMLIMLIMLIPLGLWGNPPRSKIHQKELTLLTFPLF